VQEHIGEECRNDSKINHLQDIAFESVNYEMQIIPEKAQKRY
jgi:hypothetical protein